MVERMFNLNLRLDDPSGRQRHIDVRIQCDVDDLPGMSCEPLVWNDVLLSSSGSYTYEGKSGLRTPTPTA